MIVALAITSISTGGCAPATSHTQRASTQAAHESSARTLDLLRVLGAKSAYVMAGDDLLHSGLGVLDEQGLAPATVQPAVPLMSNISGNGHEIVLGAAGIVPDVYTDGVYRLSRNKLISLGDPSQGLFGPTIASDGTIAVIQPEGGFLLRHPGGRWLRDPRLAKTTFSSLSWDRALNAFTIVHANRATARLVKLTSTGGVSTIGTAYCAGSVLHAPTTRQVALTLSTSHPRPKMSVLNAKPMCFPFVTTPSTRCQGTGTRSPGRRTLGRCCLPTATPSESGTSQRKGSGLSQTWVCTCGWRHRSGEAERLNADARIAA